MAVLGNRSPSWGWALWLLARLTTAPALAVGAGCAKAPVKQMSSSGPLRDTSVWLVRWAPM